MKGNQEDFQTSCVEKTGWKTINLLKRSLIEIGVRSRMHLRITRQRLAERHPVPVATVGGTAYFDEAGRQLTEVRSFRLREPVPAGATRPIYTGLYQAAGLRTVVSKASL